MPARKELRVLTYPPQPRPDPLDSSVLASKITIPVLPSWIVPRERIGRLVAEGARGPLTVITGPPGAGKTVALASWAASASRPGPVAWVTLDRFDNRPEIFWSYVIQALRTAGVAIAPELAAMSARQPEVFFHEMALATARQDTTVSLVLDDLHVLTERKCTDGLAYVLRNADGGLRLLVASRMDPLLPLHRYRLTGDLAEIRAEDLAFTVAEAGHLLAQHKVTLPTESLKLLTARDEGWAAGLRLAAMSMAGRPDPEQFVKELDAEDGAIAGYLMDEVLNTQPPTIRDLLLKTSILDRVSVELAGDLAGSKAAEAIPALARANAFVEPLGNGWYRYHSLFADVLRLKLRHESPQAVHRLHRRAAHWLWHNGTLQEAVSQAVAAGDWPLAARMTVEELSVGSLLHPQPCGSLAARFKPMPAPPGPAPAPLLIVAAAMALRGAQERPGPGPLADAERLLDQVPPGAEVPSRFAVAVIRLELARRRGDLAAAATAAASTEELVSRMPPALLARHPGARAQALSARATVDMFAGRFADAASSLEQAAAATSDPCEWGDCVGRRALAEAARGRLGRAGKLAAAVTEPPADGRAGIAWHPSAAAEVALAWVYLERNQLAEAARQLSRAEDALQAQPDRLIAGMAWLAAARLTLVRGRPGAAAEMAARARRGWPVPAWLEQRLRLAEAQAYAALGKAEAAAGSAGRAGAPSTPAGAVALAWARLAAHDPKAAMAALAGAPALAAGQAPGFLQLDARLLEARLCYLGGRPDRGRQALEQALKAAQGEQVLLPFAMERGWVEPLLRHDQILAEELRSLFHPNGSRSALHPGDAGAGGQAGAVIVEPLSQRELEVLGHVARMLSTAEIAEEMFLSVNTVKSHLKSIFRKLSVTHRGEAVRQAQRLALL
jgi:LuxR family transcriptional regulator, maltose regulon positive regulatory protein